MLIKSVLKENFDFKKYIKFFSNLKNFKFSKFIKILDTSFKICVEIFKL